MAGARAAFSGEGDKTQMPTAEIEKASIENGLGVINLFAAAKLGGSNSDIRRLIQQGGAAINGKTISDVKATVTLSDADSDGEFVLRAGKKKFCRVVIRWFCGNPLI